MQEKSLSLETYLAHNRTKNNCLYCAAIHVKNKNANFSRILSPGNFLEKSKQFAWFH